jgi:hypothetical protein
MKRMALPPILFTVIIALTGRASLVATALIISAVTVIASLLYALREISYALVSRSMRARS